MPAPVIAAPSTGTTNKVTGVSELSLQVGAEALHLASSEQANTPVEEASVIVEWIVFSASMGMDLLLD